MKERVWINNRIAYCKQQVQRYTLELEILQSIKGYLHKPTKGGNKCQ